MLLLAYNHLLAIKNVYFSEKMLDVYNSMINTIPILFGSPTKQPTYIKNQPLSCSLVSTCLHAFENCERFKLPCFYLPERLPKIWSRKVCAGDMTYCRHAVQPPILLSAFKSLGPSTWARKVQIFRCLAFSAVQRAREISCILASALKSGSSSSQWNGRCIGWGFTAASPALFGLWALKKNTL